MKAAQLGSDLLTAVAIATSRVADLICSRGLDNGRFRARDIIIFPQYSSNGDYRRKCCLERCLSASEAVNAEEMQSVTKGPQYLISCLGTVEFSPTIYCCAVFSWHRGSIFS